MDIYIHVHLIYVYGHVYTHVWLFMSAYILVNLYVYINMCVCMHVCDVYMYIYSAAKWARVLLPQH